MSEISSEFLGDFSVFSKKKRQLVWKVDSELGGLRFILHLACGQWDRWLDWKSTYLIGYFVHW